MFLHPWFVHKYLINDYGFWLEMCVGNKMRKKFQAFNLYFSEGLSRKNLFFVDYIVNYQKYHWISDHSIV